MENYDYIICGGGCAGLSLAYYISRAEKLKEKKVLIIEPSDKDTNDRTWCFWSSKPSAFDEITAYRWKKLEILGPFSDQLINLENYSYNMIRSIDFYRFIHEKLKASGNFYFLKQKAREVREDSGKALVYTEQGNFSAEFVFNSIYNLPLQPEKKFYQLYQHFLGWEIQTVDESFQTDIVRLMDFRIEQEQQCRFVYILPFSAREALVEFTIFSEKLLDAEEYEKQLSAYLNSFSGIKSYRVTATEKGIIPMTDRVFPVKTGKRIINTGTAGGMVKPSTGYAFRRIQKYTLALAEALAAGNEDPASVIRYSSRYRLYDRLLLDIIARQGEISRDIFITLFRNNKIEEVLKFLDEENNLAGDLKIMASVPPAPFIGAIKNLILR